MIHCSRLGCPGSSVGRAFTLNSKGSGIESHPCQFIFRLIAFYSFENPYFDLSHIAVIDLSSIEPDSLGPLHLEKIPSCCFAEKGRPYKPKVKKNKKKWRSKDEDRRGRKKTESRDGEMSGRKTSGEHRGVYTLNFTWALGDWP